MVAVIFWIAAYKLYFRKRHSWGVALVLSVVSWYVMLLAAGLVMILIGPTLGIGGP